MSSLIVTLSFNNKSSYGRLNLGQISKINVKGYIGHFFHLSSLIAWQTHMGQDWTTIYPKFLPGAKQTAT